MASTTAYLVWEQGEDDDSECGSSPDRVLATFDRAAAVAFTIDKQRAEYEKYVADWERTRKGFLAIEAKWNGWQVAYADWKEATRMAPTKALRVAATEAVQYMRTEERRFYREYEVAFKAHEEAVRLAIAMQKRRPDFTPWFKNRWQLPSEDLGGRNAREYLVVHGRAPLAIEEWVEKHGTMTIDPVEIEGVPGA